MKLQKVKEGLVITVMLLLSAICTVSFFILIIALAIKLAL